MEESAPGEELEAAIPSMEKVTIFLCSLLFYPQIRPGCSLRAPLALLSFEPEEFAVIPLI